KSSRPSTFQPLGWPAPLSVLSAEMHFFNSVACAGVYAVYPRRPCFLPSPQREANGTARRTAEGGDRTCRFQHHSAACAVVLRAGTEVPGIEMRADQDPFVRMIAAANFCNNVVHYCRA